MCRRILNNYFTYIIFLVKLVLYFTALCSVSQSKYNPIQEKYANSDKTTAYIPILLSVRQNMTSFIMLLELPEGGV